MAIGTDHILLTVIAVIIVILVIFIVGFVVYRFVRIYFFYKQNKK